MKTIHFKYVCGAAVTMVALAAIALSVGHIEKAAFINCFGTAMGILILTSMYANFK